MNLDELRSVQDAERRNSGLQHLRDSFYEEAGRYIADLKAERERVAERADDPWSSPEVGRLSDEIDTAEDVVEAIYRRRMGKLLEEASLAAADMGADEEGLTAEERELFHDVVDRIRANKTRVLDTVAGEGGGTGADDRSGGSASESGEGETGAERGETGGEPDRPGTDAGSDRRDPDAGTTRREVEPGSPPPDGGRPGSTDPSGDPQDGGGPVPTDPDDGVPAAGAMGGESDDRPSPEPDGGAAADRAPDTAPEPPSPDEFADDPAGDRSPGSTDGDPGDPTVADTPSGTGDPDDATGVPSMSAIDDRVTVRITDDVGAIYGVDDREYDLERETVVHLPAENARPLIDRGAAERLD